MTETALTETAVTEHARPHQPVAIIVNTRSYPWDAERISFEQVVELAYPEPVTDQDSFTISFTRGHSSHRTGTLTAGHHVKVQNGMVFDAYRTTRS